MTPDRPLPTVDERDAAGRAARDRTPRSAHAVLEPAVTRDPLGLLEAQNADRIGELVPIRNARMLASPFAFFRGAACVMANDLAVLPRTDLQAQLCGDAHLLNFGGFAAPDRRLVFDLDDFDETLPGPFEWDLKRLVASIEIAGRECAFARADRAAAVRAAATGYRTGMREFATLGDLRVWYARLDERSAGSVSQLAQGGEVAKALDRSVAKAHANDGMRALSELTHEVDGVPRIVSEPPLIVPLAELDGDADEAQLRAIFRSYRRSLAADRRVLLDRFHYVDSARKVVGVASVGTRCWLVLMLGRDDHDPLLLQMKEAGPSVLEPLLRPSRVPGHGRRVVEGQRLMQAASDVFLGWVHASRDLDGAPRDFHVRQLRDWKVSLRLDRIAPRGLTAYASACGWTLARAHARSGDRIAIAAYLGSTDRFDRALAQFATAYADLNERDHAAFAAAVSEGKVAAAPVGS